MKVKNYPSRIRQSIVENYFDQLGKNNTELYSFLDLMNQELNEDLFDFDYSKEGHIVWELVVKLKDYGLHDIYHYGTSDIEETDFEYVGAPSSSSTFEETENIYNDIIKEKVDRSLKEYLMEIDIDIISFPKGLGVDADVFVEGCKESDDKLVYELDWEYIQALAERMAKNKGKYPRDNWKKKIDITSLEDALTRHFMAIIQGEYEDDGDEYGHLEALALNCMMIRHQLKNNS